MFYNNFVFIFIDRDDTERKIENRKDNRRRVSFKPSGAGPQQRLGKGYTAELAIRSRLEEDDEMGDFVSRGNEGNVSLNKIK